MQIITTKITRKGYVIKLNNKVVKQEVNGKKTKYFTKEEANNYIKTEMGL